jgi:hypothetical protein
MSNLTTLAYLFLYLITLSFCAVILPNGLKINGISLNAGTINGITPNGISLNGGTLNGIFINGIPGSTNGVQPNGIDGSTNGGFTLDDARQILANDSMIDIGSFQELLPYLIRCALPLGTEWSTSINGSNEGQKYIGGYGLAPSFEHIPLTYEQQLLVTSCLMADVNYYGKHIYISVRNNPFSEALMDEMLDFPVYEGAFFGNIFSENITKFTCIGEDKETAWKESPDRQWRICTEDQICDFKSLGKCSEVCDDYNKNYGYTYCTGSDGVKYPAMNVYLKAKERINSGPCQFRS